MLQACLCSPPNKKGVRWGGAGQPDLSSDRYPAWCRLSRAYQGHCHGWAAETGGHGETKAGAQDSAALSAMKLDNIKHLFISDLPPCAAGVRMSCPAPWKPSSSVVCRRETILLTISTSAHSRPAILLTGLFRVEKLQFCYGNSMGCWGLISGQTSKTQVDRRGQMKGHMHHMHICFTPLVILSMLNLTLQPWPSSFFFSLRKSWKKL